MKKLVTYLILSLSVNINSLAQINECKILPGDGETKDQFGFSVSIDGNYAIVGAWFDDNSTGSAYIFRREGTNWIEEQKLIANDGKANDRFGWSVSISAGNAIVGSPLDDDSTGSVYVFSREGTNWIEKQKLTASDGIMGDLFGFHIAISAEYIIVGSPMNDDSKGAAYLFRREGTNWIEDQKLILRDDTLSIYFGLSVSISGSYTIVGVPWSQVNGRFSGSAYIYKRQPAAWVEKQRITPITDTLSAFFGYSVSISEDYAIVSAPLTNNNGNGSGTVYIFAREDSIWTEEIKLIGRNGPNDGWFGRSVSLCDEYVFVGAPGDHSYGGLTGAAYIFRKEDNSWIEEKRIITGDSVINNGFGASVSISGNNAIVGVPGDDDNGESSGSAYIFSGFVVGDENDETEIPLAFKLNQNYPNPFNPSTTIKFSLPSSGYITLKIYNTLGEEVAVLLNKELTTGNYEVEWNATGLPSGVYFYRLKTEEFIETKKMLLIK